MENLDQGHLTFNREGIIHEGATKITELFLETNLFESEVRNMKNWDILFKKEGDKTYLKRWIQKVFEGSLSFKDLKEFVKKNRLIVEAANKFLFDEGHAIQVSELIKKEKKIENIDELLNYLK